MCDIRWDRPAVEDMKRMKLRAYEVRQIVDAVDEQLTHQAERESKRRKLIRPGSSCRSSTRGRFGNFGWVNSESSTMCRGPRCGKRAKRGNTRESCRFGRCGANPNTKQRRRSYEAHRSQTGQSAPERI